MTIRVLISAVLLAMLWHVESPGRERKVRSRGPGPCEFNSDCDDLSDCTDDSCVDGSCRFSNRPQGVSCADDGLDCTFDRCDGTGNCTHTNKPSGEVCGPPVVAPCDAADICDGAGICVAHFAPAGTNCETTPQACTDELCSGQGLCEVYLVTGPCNDGQACMVLDTCSNGTCLGVPVDCTSAGDACNDAFCDVTGPEGNCDDRVPRPAGTDCDDGAFCNGTSLCDDLGTCVEGPPPCAEGEYCIEQTDDCLAGVDCNANDVPDQCDLTCGLPGDACRFFATCGQSSDCNGNTVPDECDLAACPRTPDCDDCNLNGVLDECDIASGQSMDASPADGVPDECVTSAPGQHNWTDDIWNLSGGYPSNIQNVSSLYVTLDASQIFLNETVEIEGLRLRSGSILEVTQIGTGDLRIDPVASGGIWNDGAMVVGNDRLIDVQRGPLRIGEGGTFIGDPTAGSAVSATIITDTLWLGPTLCGAADQVTFRGGMVATLFGDLILDGRGATPCPCFPELCGGTGNTVSIQGGRTLPIFRHFSVAAVAARGVAEPAGVTVHGAFRVLGGAVVEVRPEAGGPGGPVFMQVGNDFDNQSIYPSLFDWAAGGLILAPNPGPARFEVAGIDLGSTFEGFDTDTDALADRNRHSNFAMGFVSVANGAVVTFENATANTVGAGPCEEALYVHDLELGAGSTITLNNCRIYHGRLLDSGAAIDAVGCGGLVQLATGDFNADQFVDGADWLELTACLGGPEVSPADPRCVVFDFDVDGDVDLMDAGRMTEIYDES